MLRPGIEPGPKRWQRSILPLNYRSLVSIISIIYKIYAIILLVLCYRIVRSIMLTGYIKFMQWIKKFKMYFKVPLTIL